MKEGSVRFAVMGDTGTGEPAQYEVGEEMAYYHKAFPFEFVIMCGDNLYGGSSPEDFRTKFEMPYAGLREAKVKFYASLGNHDNPLEVNYKDWNMGGKRYYTWQAAHGLGGVNVRFFALDSNYMDKKQLDWLETELKNSGSEWKLAFFHHPLYSSGRFHGSSYDLRTLVEPLFIKYKMNAVFSGHDHIYERIKPQHGVNYFVSGSGGALRRGNIYVGSPLTEAGYDADCHFMLVEIADMELYFQAVSRTGKVVDYGKISHPG